jgi:hypothetical protein
MRLATTLVQQRNDTDCAVCAVAMALDLPYDRVMAAAMAAKCYSRENGTSAVYKVLEKLGLSYTFLQGKPIGDFTTRMRDYALSNDIFRDMVWGRPAIITAKSINGAFSHAVWYDGEKVYDPSARQVHTSLWTMEIEDTILFAPGFRSSVEKV